jgi:hypothetical protein
MCANLALTYREMSAHCGPTSALRDFLASLRIRQPFTVEVRSRGGPALSNLVWRRSRACSNGACLEFATDGDTIFTRDSKDPSGPMIVVSKPAWHAFVEAVARGQIARPAA